MDEHTALIAALRSGDTEAACRAIAEQSQQVRAILLGAGHQTAPTRSPHDTSKDKIVTEHQDQHGEQPTPTLTQQWETEQQNWQQLLLSYTDAAAADEQFLTHVGNAMRGPCWPGNPIQEAVSNRTSLIRQCHHDQRRGRVRASAGSKDKSAP